MSTGTQQAALPLHSKLVNFFYGKLARASAWLLVGGIVGGILGYVFQVLMGRMLSTQEYGLFSAMMALFGVLAAPLGTLSMLVSRKVSEYRARHESGSITHFYYSISIRITIIGVITLSMYFLLAPQIQFFLKVPSIISVYLLGVLLFLTFLSIINNSFLQGMQHFLWLSASSSIGVLLKIIFSALLVWMGYGLTGALGGTVLAFLVGWFITYCALHGPLVEGRSLPFQSAHLFVKPALPVLAVNVAIAAMTQIDILLVNYYFSANEASLYAAASILGKAILYLPGGITLALLPIVAENHARAKSSAHLLLQAVGLTAVLSGSGATFYFLLGEKIIVLLYTENYRGAGEVLKFYGFAIFPMTLVMVAESFLIAKGRVLFACLFVFTAPLQLIAIYFFHDSLQMVVAVMGASGLLIALLGFGLLWRDFKKNKYEDKS